MRSRLAFPLLLLVAAAAPAAADDSPKWGAIAYGGATRSSGTAVDFATPGEARDAALASCGGQCSQTIVFQRNCAAVAATSNGTPSWSRNRWRDRAIARALADCRKRDGNCTLVAWACTAH